MATTGPHRNPELSAEQAEVLELMVRSVMEYGFQPTTREMAERFGITPAAVRDRLFQLVRKGFLTPPPYKSERCYGVRHVKFVPVFAEADEPPVAPESDEDAAIRREMRALLAVYENRPATAEWVAEEMELEAALVRRLLAGDDHFERLDPAADPPLWRLKEGE